MYKVGDRLEVIVDKPAAAKLSKGEIVTVVSRDPILDSFNVVSVAGDSIEWSLRDEHVKLASLKSLEDGELLAVVQYQYSHSYPRGLLIRVKPHFDAEVGIYRAIPVYCDTEIAKRFPEQQIPQDEFITVITGAEGIHDV